MVRVRSQKKKYEAVARAGSSSDVRDSFNKESGFSARSLASEVTRGQAVKAIVVIEEEEAGGDVVEIVDSLFRAVEDEVVVIAAKERRRGDAAAESMQGWTLVGLGLKHHEPSPSEGMPAGTDLRNTRTAEMKKPNAFMCGERKQLGACQAEGPKRMVSSLSSLQVHLIAGECSGRGSRQDEHLIGSSVSGLFAREQNRVIDLTIDEDD
jgi:hypothetical protein